MDVANLMDHLLSVKVKKRTQEIVITVTRYLHIEVRALS